jgi:hypothetical protein
MLNMAEKSDQTPENQEEIPSEDELWDEIGFHKPLAGFWYNMVFLMVNMVTGTFLTSFMISYFYPFPESLGFISTVDGIFALFFFTFDIGTAAIMERFVPAARINNQLRMLQYIRYFVWYQMMTGLVQITAVSVYCIYFASDSSLLYLTWIMLIICSKQYPGMLGVFYGALNSLQYFNKTALISFTQGEIMKRLIDLLFVWAGMAIGNANPAIGMLLGIALGSAVGKIADDYVGMLLSAYFFSKVMKKEGITMLDCFKPDFPLELVKEVFTFGIKTSLPGFFSGATSLYILSLYITYMPGYTTFIALSGMAGGIVSDTSYARLSLTALYSESFMNGKKHLSQTILMKGWWFAGQILGFYFAVFISVYFLLPDAFQAFRLFNYLGALPFIIPGLIANTIDIFLAQEGQILTGCNKPSVITIASLSEQGLNILLHTIFLVWLSLADSYAGVVFILIFGKRIAQFCKQICTYIYIHKKLFHIRVAWYQTFVVPIITSAICNVIVISFKKFVFDPILADYGFYIAIIPFILAMLIVCFGCYFPLYTFLGGHDRLSLIEFSKIVNMSGPSKFIVRPLYNLAMKAARKSPIKDRFMVVDEVATQEAMELYKLKVKSRTEYTQAKQNNPELK